MKKTWEGHEKETSQEASLSTHIQLYANRFEGIQFYQSLYAGGLYIKVVAEAGFNSTFHVGENLCMHSNNQLEYETIVA